MNVNNQGRLIVFFSCNVFMIRNLIYVKYSVNLKTKMRYLFTSDIIEKKKLKSIKKNRREENKNI